MSLYNDILSDVFGNGNIDRKLGGFNSQVQAEFHYEISTALENHEIDREAFDKLWSQVEEDYPVKKQKLPGRKPGFSPIYGDGGAMIKKRKAWSMTQECWDWLESQKNQSETLRELIESRMEL